MCDCLCVFVGVFVTQNRSNRTIIHRTAKERSKLDCFGTKEWSKDDPRVGSDPKSDPNSDPTIVLDPSGIN